MTIFRFPPAVWLLAFLGGLALLLACSGQFGPTPAQKEEILNTDPNICFGNPSGATEDEGDKDNYLMRKKYFVLSYNNTKGTPNWVSWRVVKEDLGNAPRAPTCYPDEDLPAGFKVVRTEDYVNSGFDRGHMCPHSDRSSSDEASKATFVMTNIVPRSSANNDKALDRFAEYGRSLVAKQDKELYIVCGPHGQGGVGKKGLIKSIGTIMEPEKIIVPATTWKVVLVLNRGGKVDQAARLIAVIVPNDQTVGEDWAKYRVPVKQVEQLTGYKFFDRADPAIIGPLKGQVDAEAIR